MFVAVGSYPQISSRLETRLTFHDFLRRLRLWLVLDGTGGMSATRNARGGVGGLADYASSATGVAPSARAETDEEDLTVLRMGRERLL